MRPDNLPVSKQYLNNLNTSNCAVCCVVQNPHLLKGEKTLQKHSPFLPRETENYFFSDLIERGTSQGVAYFQLFKSLWHDAL